MTLTGKPDRRITILLWLGVAAPLLRHLCIYLLGIATPGYSARRDFLSELSAIDAPYAVFMGLLGVGIVGLLMIAAAFGLYRALGSRPLSRLTAMLVGISGLGFVIVALAPCDPGCIVVEQNFRMQVHLLGGLIGMGAEVGAALTFGIGALVWRQTGGVGVISLVLGIVGIAALILLFSLPVGLAENAGLIQRVVQGSGDLWLLILCWSCAMELRRRPPHEIARENGDSGKN